MSITLLTEELAEKVDNFFESKQAHRYIISLVLLNSIVIGLDFVPAFKENYATLLSFLDKAILSIFILELTARIIITRERFFKNYWNVFDLLVTLISIIPVHFNLSALRLLRVLHCMRLLELFPKTKHIIDSVAHSMKGILNVVMLALIFFYIFSIIATGLFAATSPDKFGSLQTSMLTLFQFMTSPNWDPINKMALSMPWALLFFGIFLLVIGYFIMNLVIGVIVGAMAAAEQENEGPSQSDKAVEFLGSELVNLHKEVVLLRADVQGLKDKQGN